MTITWLAITFQAARDELEAPLHESALSGAEEAARRLEVGARRPDLPIATGLVVSVLALVEQDQIDGPAEAQRLVDPVVPRFTRNVGMLSK